MDKAKSALGGGGGDRKAGGVKVMNIIEVLDVGVPLRTAYDHWTQYDQFNEFTKGVTQVSKSDEAESDWKVKIGLPRIAASRRRSRNRFPTTASCGRRKEPRAAPEGWSASTNSHRP